MNPDFHFVLVMDVIVCTAGVGYVLRTSVCTSPTALEAEVLGSGLEFVMMVNHVQTEIVMQYGGLRSSVTCVTTSCSNDSHVERRDQNFAVAERTER
jgi:hypothetical protein